MDLDEIRQRLRAREEKSTKRIFAKKKKEGYKFWCYTPGYPHHRIYFRSLESAEAWLKKTKHAYVGYQIDKTIYEVN